MAYFPDHSEYRFGLEPTLWKADGPPPDRPEGLYSWLWDFPDPEAVHGMAERNMGWLDAKHDFPRGTPDVTFAKLLEQACSTSTYHLWRGYQTCDLCGAHVPRPTGPGEIRVQGADCVYASPTLISHHVARHGYAPPPDYVRGVLEAEGRPPEPAPGTRRKIPPDLLVHGDVGADALSAAVSRWLRVFHGENEVRDLAITREEDSFVVRAVFITDDARQSSPRTWLVPRDAVLNEEQGGRGIVSMLSDALNQRAAQAFRLRRGRAGGTP